jgi:hypothetical protein
MTKNTKSCCCPEIEDVVGVYIHDSGLLPGQFSKTLTLSEDGTFQYHANFDAGFMSSSGIWKVIAQGATCFLQLASNPEPVNELIEVRFDRTLLRLDGSCLRTEVTGGATFSFFRTASAFPENA